MGSDYVMAEADGRANRTAMEPMYTLLILRAGKAVTIVATVDDAFARKKGPDEVFVRLNATGFVARVLRPS